MRQIARHFPRHAGQLPVYYNAQPSKKYWIEKGWGVPYADLDPTPLFAFGHGLSYTSFHYEDLRIKNKLVNLQSQIELSFKLKNTGNRAGTETVQLYIRDLHSSVTTPIMAWKGFEKVHLEAGQEKIVNMSLDVSELKLLNKHLDWVVEPGEFLFMVGSSSDIIRLREKIEVDPRH